MIVPCELLLVMFKISKKESFRSFNGLAPLLKQAMLDSNIIQHVTLQSTKAAYLVSEALGPYFRNQMLSSIDPQNFFCVQFDETTNDIKKKELQIGIRYFCKDTKQVKTDFNKYFGDFYNISYINIMYALIIWIPRLFRKNSISVYFKTFGFAKSRRTHIAGFSF